MFASWCMRVCWCVCITTTYNVCWSNSLFWLSSQPVSQKERNSDVVRRLNEQLDLLDSNIHRNRHKCFYPLIDTITRRVVERNSWTDTMCICIERERESRRNKRKNNSRSVYAYFNKCYLRGTILFSFIYRRGWFLLHDQRGKREKKKIRQNDRDEKKKCET